MKKCYVLSTRKTREIIAIYSDEAAANRSYKYLISSGKYSYMSLILKTHELS